MRSLRINQSVLTLLVIALLGALLLPPDSGGWLKGPASILFFPVSAAFRGVASAVNARVAPPRRPAAAEGSKTYEQLQNELETLKSQYLVLKGENDELRARLDERKDWPAELLKQCKVVPVTGGDAGNQQALTLRPGVLENPTDNAAVLVGTDVVGKLKVVGLGAEKVELITDRRSVVSGQLTHYQPDGSGIERVDAPLCAVRGDGSGKLIVKGYKLTYLQRPDKSLKVKPGDRVVLQDPDWPAAVQNFCIGKIESIEPGAGPLFCDIVIRPQRDLMKLREVMVLKK